MSAHWTYPDPDSEDALQPPKPSYVHRNSSSSLESLEPASSTSDSDSPPISIRNRKSVQPRALRVRSSSGSDPAAVSVDKSARRRSTQSTQGSGSHNYAAVDHGSRLPDPFADASGTTQEWSADSLYQDVSAPPSPRTAVPGISSPMNPRSPETHVKYPSYRERGHKPPPSSFAFPFQAYPGNPDPGTHVPGAGPTSRRSSLDRPFSTDSHDYPTTSSSLGHGRDYDEEETSLPRPVAPFMAEHARADSANSSGSASPVNSRPNSVYRNSAAGSLSELNTKVHFPKPIFLVAISDSPLDLNVQHASPISSSVLPPELYYFLAAACLSYNFIHSCSCG